MTSRDHTKTPVHHASRITHHASLLLLAFQLVSLSASPATITFHLQKFTQAAATNRATLITPLSITPPAGQLALYDRALYLSDTNGAFTVTNMLPGAYRCVVQSPPDRTEFWITVPATNATLYAADLLVVPTNSTAGPDSLAYSITASDARYAPLGSISASASQTNWPASAITNAPWITNGQTLASLTINSTAESDPALTIQTDTDTAPTLEIKTGSMLIGRIHPAGLTNWLAGAFTADAFYGDGAGLSNLPAASVSGVLSLTNLPDAVVTNGSGPSFGTTYVGQLGVAGGGYGRAYVVIDENGDASGKNGSSENVWSLGITGMSQFMRGIVVGADPGPPNTNTFTIDGDGIAYGNGYGITNLQPVNIVGAPWITNNQPGVALTGSFTGDGEGLTNIAPGAIASAPWLTGASNIAGARITGTITNQVSTASYTDYVNSGTNIVISPTNGNLQSWTLTNASWAQLAAANTNFTETIRMNIYSSNTLTWASGTLSNATVLGPSNAISVMLFDHVRGTNLWQGYRLR